MRRASKTTSLILTALFIISVIPVASVSADSTENDPVYYGVEYDWKNIDGDLEGLTGLDFDAMLQDVMDAASEAGFTLVIAEITTGSSNMYVSSIEDKSTQTIEYAGGDDVEVWSRTTDLSIRHAVLVDTALLTDWDETKFGGTETSFDIQISVDGENTFTADATYVEYFDSDYNLAGADLDFSFGLDSGMEITIDAEFKGDGETLNIDFTAGADIGFALDSSHLEWRLGEGSALYPALAGNDYVEFWCDDYDYGVEEDGDYATVIADCGEMDGSYASSAAYSLNVDGIPTEELGLDAGEFDIEISDSISDIGVVDLDEDDLQYDGTDFEFGDSYAIETDAGESTNVRSCVECGPVNPMMFFMMEYILEPAFEGLSEEFEEEMEDNEEIEELQDFDEDEVEPSTKLEKIGEAFEESGLENVMETFGENLEDKFQDVEEGEFPYIDGQGHFYWSDSHATIVGFGVYVEDNNENWHTWVGPSTAGFSNSPPAPISVVYLTGQAAQDAMTDAEDDDSIEEIVDVTQHDISELEEILVEAGVNPADLGIGDNTSDNTDNTQTAEDLAEDGGLLPFISPVTVVGVTLLAGFVASRRSRLEEE